MNRKMNRLETIEEIISSDSYAECLDLYNKYVLDLANLFIDLDVTNPLEVTMLYNACLHNGLLSKNRKYRYKKFANDPDYIPNLWGSRVATGNGICRHSTALVTDLINKTGGVATNLVVKYTEELIYLKYPELFGHNLKRCNHMVTGIIDGNKKFVYDATNQRYAIFESLKDKKLFRKASNYAYALDRAQEQGVYNLNNDLSKRVNCNILLWDNLRKFINMGGYPIDYQYALEVEDYLVGKMSSKIPFLFDFAREQEAVIERIAELNEMVAPHNDNKIISKKLR